MWTVQELADRLTRHGQEANLRAVFDLSHRALPPAQRRLFRLLGLHAGADFTAESAAALHHTTPERAEVLLESLLDEHLLQQATAGRYRMHDLLRAYARDRAQAEEPPARRRAAVHRLLTWYLHTAESARTELDPHRSRIFDLVPLRAGCMVRTFGGYDEALAWFEAERSTLREVVATAAHRAPEVAWQLPWVLLSFYYRRSHWDDWVATYEIGLAAARSLGERRGEAIMWRGLGVANSDLRRFEVALDCHRRAQALLERVGDRHGQAWNLNNAGVIHFDLGELTEAAGHFERALLVQHGIGDQAGLRFTLSTLGDLHRDNGRLGEALRHYREALATSRMLADQRITARVLAGIAETLTADGKAEQARTYWCQALTIFDELGDAQAESVRAKLTEIS
ncbi:tetratricopeptide repeat protein [Amycolatopsis magusensis]|uniref:tetratricopeptide repeat protein n=1 Tax=Amycolatopsis magusensis TaxID=882444 RepID=UPI00379FBBE3